MTKLKYTFVWCAWFLDEVLDHLPGRINGRWTYGQWGCRAGVYHRASLLGDRWGVELKTDTRLDRFFASLTD